MTAFKVDSNDNLKPCPFCNDEGHAWLRMNGKFPQVQCESCGAIGPTWNYRDLAPVDLVDEAAAHWNERRTCRKDRQ